MYQNKITKLIAVILIVALLGSVTYYFSGTELFQGKIINTKTKKTKNEIKKIKKVIEEPKDDAIEKAKKKITVINSFTELEKMKGKDDINFIALAILEDAKKIEKALKGEKCNVGETVNNWTYGMLQSEFKNEQTIITDYIGCISLLPVDDLKNLSEKMVKAFEKSNIETVRINIQLILNMADLTKNWGEESPVISLFTPELKQSFKKGFPSNIFYTLDSKTGNVIGYPLDSAGVCTGEECVNPYALLNAFGDPPSFIQRGQCPLTQMLENGEIEYEGEEYYACPSDCPDETGNIRVDSLAGIQLKWGNQAPDRAKVDDINSKACEKNKDSDAYTELISKGYESCLAGSIDIPEDENANVIACIDPKKNNINLNGSQILLSVGVRGCSTTIDEGEDAGVPNAPPDAGGTDDAGTTEQGATGTEQDANTNAQGEVPDAVFAPEVPSAKDSKAEGSTKAEEVAKDIITMYNAANDKIESEIGVKIVGGIEIPVVNTTIDTTGKITLKIPFSCGEDSGNCPPQTQTCNPIAAQILENKNCFEIQPQTFLEENGISHVDLLINNTDKDANKPPSCTTQTNKNNSCNNVDCAPGYETANFGPGECCGVSVQELEQQLGLNCLMGEGGACGDAPDKF